MTHINGCQIPCIPRMAQGLADIEPQPLLKRFKSTLAVPWNYYIKHWLKSFYRFIIHMQKRLFKSQLALSDREPGSQSTRLSTGDWVRVRSLEKIQATLDPFNELKGCAFLSYMADYCGTEQRVLQPVQRFLDERDYKVKKTKGVVLLDGVICKGTPVFGQCDRCCYLFWREEWLVKIETE